MAWSGGTFSRSHDWTSDAGSGIDIEAVRMDQEDDNFAEGINTCLTKDGQNSPTADLPMGGNRHTNVANANARNTYASAADVQDQDLTYFVDSGAADAYVITPSPAITAYEEGQRFVFRATNANTGASTLNVNSEGAIAIQTNDGNALTAGMIAAGGYYEVTYDANGSRFVLTSPHSLTSLLDANNTVGNDNLRDSAAVSVIGRSANSSGDPADIAAGANDRLLRRTSNTVNFGQLTAGMFPNTVVPDAALSSNVPLKDASNVFTKEFGFNDEAIRIVADAPFIQWRETDQGSNAKNWSMGASSSALEIRARSDDDMTSNVAIRIARTATNVDTIALSADSITLTGETDVTGALTATSYGGIAEANLVDKSATETVSGSWTFSADITMSGTRDIDATTRLNLTGATVSVGESGGILGFYGGAGIAKGTVSGSRADTDGNPIPALTSLIARLEELGLITDSTTP